MWKNNELIFNLEAIRGLRDEFQRNSEDLQNYKKAIIEELANLKKGWRTAAGRKYISEIDFDWISELDKYVRIINAVDELLAEAEKEYAEVQEEVLKLTI